MTLRSEFILKLIRNKNQTRPTKTTEKLKQISGRLTAKLLLHGCLVVRKKTLTVKICGWNLMHAFSFLSLWDFQKLHTLKVFLRMRSKCSDLIMTEHYFVFNGSSAACARNCLKWPYTFVCWNRFQISTKIYCTSLFNNSHFNGKLKHNTVQ